MQDIMRNTVPLGNDRLILVGQGKGQDIFFGVGRGAEGVVEFLWEQRGGVEFF